MDSQRKSLCASVVRLAHQNPELRPLLLPLLKQAFYPRDLPYERVEGVEDAVVMLQGTINRLSGPLNLMRQSAEDPRRLQSAKAKIEAFLREIDQTLTLLRRNLQQI